MIQRTRRRASRFNGFTFPASLVAASAAAAAATAYFMHGRASERRPSRARRTAFHGMTVGEVMVDDVLTIDAGDSLLQAAQLMREGNVGVLPVVSEGRLRGIITDRDIVVRGIAEGAVPTMATVGECASWDIVCARRDSSIEDAMEVMSDCQIGRLPVVNHDNQVIGIVTLSSLALRSSAQGEALETAQEVSKRSSRAA
jgi:CBS domain-containing protein